MSDRFDGAALWVGLTPEAQATIGALALELTAAWWAQEQAADFLDGSDVILRAAETAGFQLEEEMRQTVCDAMPERAFLCDDGAARLPSLLGPVCRGCGCSDSDACADGCEWAGEELCSACADRGLK